MERHTMWTPWEGTGLEYLRLSQDGAGISADGSVIGVEGTDPFSILYRIRCDAEWRVRELTVEPLDGEGISLLADGSGRWTTADEEHVPLLDGCIDVDISATPFTNTLPIRRLNLEPGESEEIEVLYIAVPEMRVEPARQRYTCLERGAEGGFYRYESLDEGGFTADLPVDADGLVLNYPEIFRRVPTG